MATIKIFDIDDLTEEQKQAYGVISKNENIVSDQMGIFNRNVLEPSANYIRAPAEQVLGHEGPDANIIIGRDRPGMINDGIGYGSIGAQKAASIDIVVGRMAAVREGKGPSSGTFVNPSFGADAARIHISQMTDIDLNFGLAPGRLGDKLKGRSGIGIKADGVRIIGREGIKLTTGASYSFQGFGSNGETNSKGGKLLSAPYIELNAGNITEEKDTNGVLYLQGVARGQNTIDAIDELRDLVDQIVGAMINFAMLQCAFNTVVGVNVFHGHYAGAGTPLNNQILSAVNRPLKVIRDQLNSSFPNNYLTENAFKKISSSKVITT